MDIQKYIASGILEQYVLGTLSAAERSEVERFAAQYPAIRQEIEAIEGAFEEYAHSHSIETPPGLEREILKKIQSRETPPKPPANAGGSSSFFKILSLAALLAAVAAIIWAVKLSGEKSAVEQERSLLQASYDSLAADCAQLQLTQQQTEQQIAFLRDQNTSPVVMKGTDKAPDAVATVYWNRAQGKSYLDIVNMPAVPPGKQYQLWAIVDGKPVDMGVFDVSIGQAGFVEVPFIENPQAFAVTLENAGGSPVPTLEEMYVIGNAS